MDDIARRAMPTDNMLRKAGIDKETARYMKYKALRRMYDLEALCMGCPVNKLVELGVYDENR